ncbi:class I SAM-dependent methyltransferase [Nocardia sp. CDC160]|uniref:class I SAM-dependent methyltransferase n=1 Tax=Nocardia sp. CDC160 TaxID=3112166 RepID=UPI002DB6E62A|nr:class I SAM-dependent methyltransferase [Nocardia sp. CDC160]MEC3915313.1 class I SAM-dependent methyltransferase [Nocardia sp. CDC160]
MENGPSRTAMMAAAGRAAHLIVDREPHLFRDTVAETLLGDRAAELIAYHRESGDHPVLSGTRAQVNARSHYTEARLAAGFEQYVILGAGLDTFAYRSPLAGRVAVYEVDHPATQAWKRELLSTAGIDTATVEFVGVDFERDDLAAELTAHGFDPKRPALVSWLGVTMYLTESAIATTLSTLSGFAPGTELVMEYAVLPELRDESGRVYAEFALAATAGQGEPMLSFFSPDTVTALLECTGFTVAAHVSQRDAVDAALWRRDDALHPADFCRLVRAHNSGRTRI